MTFGFLALGLVAGYLIGSLPFGYWVARAHGVNIFKVGSGNPGATNVKRAVGRRAGNLVFALDFCKGLAAAGWPLLVASPAPTLAAVAGLIGAIFGHSFSLFTRFRGGKGVATTIGGLVGLMPLIALVGIGVWLVVFYATRYVSLASIAFAASLPVTSLILARPPEVVGFSFAVAVFILARHHANIRRLLAGTEARFVPGSRNGPAAPPSP